MVSISETRVRNSSQLRIDEKRLGEATDELTAEFPGAKIHSRVSDIECAEEREKLFQWIRTTHPETNVLINNAGIQQRYTFVQDSTSKTPWVEREKEIQVNLCAPIHLTNLWIDHFRSLVPRRTAIVNVTSDLAFLPLAQLPVYSSTKAALHSFTSSLPVQMSADLPSFQIYEVIPPPVQTNLGGHHPFGEPADEFGEAIFAQFIRGKE